MAICLRHVLFLTTLLSSALAVPTDHKLSFQTPVHSDSSLSYIPRSPPRPWSRFCDTIIETIWGSPRRGTASSHSLQRPSTPPNFQARYGGDVVLRFKTNSLDETKALLEASEILYLDVWESTEFWVDIRLAKEVVPSFLGLLPPSLRQSHSPLMHDLSRTVFETYPRSSSRTLVQYTSATSSINAKPDDGSHEMYFREYQPLSVMYPWMRLMASLFPGHMEMITIGHSYEGRAITGLRLRAQPTSSDDPPRTRDTILITGGSHAREWISTTTVNYMAYNLATRYGKFRGVTKLLEQFDLVLIPTINPDGYVYTWEVDRLWRKNRQSTPLAFCQGIDLDRAFGYEWDGEASRDNPCSETYAGLQPFSGVEALALASWAHNETEQNNVNFVAYIDLHSYSQQVLYPYSYSCTDVPPSLEDLEEVAIGIAKGFRLANGHYYGVSSACEGSAVSSDGKKKPVQHKAWLGGGSGLDWFFHDLRVKYAYQVKLRDTGSYGFLLPRENIIPTGQEGFNAVMKLGQWLLGNKGVELGNEAGEEIDWDSEMIVNNNSAPIDVPHSGSVAEESGDADKMDAEMLLDADADTDDYAYDYAYDLNKRRRRR